MSTRSISVADFPARAEEALQEVEHAHTVVNLVRDGEVVAYLTPASKPKGETGTLEDWCGTGLGYELASGCSLDDPGFEAHEWEEAKGDDD